MSVKVTHKRLRVGESFKDRYFVQREATNEVVARLDDKDEAINYAKKLNLEEKEWRKTVR